MEHNKSDDQMKVPKRPHMNNLKRSWRELFRDAALQDDLNRITKKMKTMDTSKEDD